MLGKLFTLILLILAFLMTQVSAQIGNSIATSDFDLNADNNSANAAMTGGQSVPNTGNYNFSTATNESLTDMTGSTVLIGAGQSSVSSIVVPINFDFYFMGVPTPPSRFTSFSVNTHGVLQLGAAPISSNLTQPLNHFSNLSVIAPFAGGQRTHSTGKVHYKITGAAPNRVLIIEWLNMQSSANPASPDLTYQARLFESSGAIQFAYGSMNVVGNYSAQIGFASPVISAAEGTIGTVTAPQNGTPTYNGFTNSPVNNAYTAGAITSLTSAANGSRRVMTFTPPIPAAPSNLTFTNVAASSLTLNWQDNSTNENGFAVYVSTDGVNYNFVRVLAQDVTTTTVSGLAAGANYTFRVFAVSEGGLSQALQNSLTTAGSGAISSTATGGNWSDPATWIGGVVPTANDTVTIASGATVIVDVNNTAAYDLLVDGTLEYNGGSFSAMRVNSISISAGGTFRASASSGANNATVNVAGNLTNNGILDFSTNTNTICLILSFNGDANATFGGAGATTNVCRITVNKTVFGNSASMLELNATNFTVRGSTTEATNGFLTMQSGIFKLSGTFAGTHKTFFSFFNQLPAGATFWLNNPNFTVAYNQNDIGDGGAVRVSNGSFNVGSDGSAAKGLKFVSDIFLENGAINVDGETKANNYTQTGGTLTAAKNSCAAAVTANATGGSFTMSGGSIVLQGRADCTGGLVPSYTVTATNINITGGTLQTGNAASGATANFSVSGRAFNLVTNAASGTHTTFATNATILNTTTVAANTTLNATDSSANGNTTINAGGSLTALRFRQHGATFTNNGTLRVTADTSNPPVSSFSFSGTTAQTYTGSGVAGTNTTPLAGFDIFNTSGVTIDPTSLQIITSRVNLFAGTFTNSSKIQIGTGGTGSAIIQRGNANTQIEPPGEFDVAPVFNVGSGGLQLFYANAGTNITTALEVPTTRVVQRVLINCPNGLTLNGGDLTVSNASPVGSLLLTNGIFNTGTDNLIVGATTGVTRTNGHVNGNLRMIYGATGSKIFHVGTANGYSPVTANVTTLAINPSNLTVKAIQTNHPNAPNPSSALKRFWQLTEAGNLTATLVFQYLDADLPAVSESSLELKRYTGSGTIFDTVPATLNTSSNTIQTTGGISDFSDWTLLSPLAPTAASVWLSGRVIDAAGRGIFGATIVMTGTSGNLRYARTNPFGFYRFANVPSGESYVLLPSHKRFVFAPQIVFVTEERGDVNFTARPEE